MSRRSLAAILVSSLLGACATPGAPPVAPQPPAPQRWGAASNPAAPDPVVLASWWRQFDDALLDALVADALAGSVDLASARAQLREARARRALAAAQLGPSASTSASAARSQSSSQAGTGLTSSLYDIGLDASWEPDVFGAGRRALEAAQADTQARMEALRDARVSLAAEVAIAYVDLRTAQRRTSLTESAVLARRETLQLARWREQAGLASALEVAQADTELESASASLPPLHTAAELARQRLAVLAGATPGTLDTRLAAAAPIPLPTAPIAAGAPADTLRQRPDVRAAERRLAAQIARLGAAQAARFPSVRLSGSIALQALPPGAPANAGALARSLLAGISAPVFDAGRIDANVAVQDALVEQARLAYRASVLAALADVEGALVSLADLQARRERLEEAAGRAREMLRIAEARYTSGLADFAPVLDGQRSVLGLEDQHALATGDLARAQIRLYKALGGGWSPLEPEPDEAGEDARRSQSP